jgi:SNF2 family DNA or RNA helicase
MGPVTISAKHRAIAVEPTDQLKHLFPGGKLLALGGSQVLVLPHGPVETFMLRKLGYDVPAPILTHYEWPHPASQPPFEAQKRTAALLTTATRAYVLNDLGTGKTRAALWAWDYLRSNNLVGKLLVVAPLSTLKFTWAREVFATLPERSCEVLHGTKEKRLELLAKSDAEIFIVNHDGLKVLGDALTSRADIDALCIDELAVYRNPTAQRTKQIRKYALQMKWVWGMTGRPIPNCPTDVWAQATIVTPHTVPKFFGRFRDDLMYKATQFLWLPKPDAVEKAFAALQPSVRFTLDDVQELPECIHRTVDVELGAKQAKVYKEMASACYAAVQAQEITAANAGAAMSKLLQISTGWVYTREGAVVPLDNDKRIEVLIDAVSATERKCLVFVPFKHALAGISAAFTKAGIEHATVSGDTPANERAQIFNTFQNTGKYSAIVAHPQCLAHGITLTAADTIIWFSPTTSLEIYEQANARISRVGQKHKQLILHLQGTPVERRIYSLLQKKQVVQKSLLDLFEAATDET